MSMVKIHVLVIQNKRNLNLEPFKRNFNGLKKFNLKKKLGRGRFRRLGGDDHQLYFFMRPNHSIFSMVDLWRWLERGNPYCNFELSGTGRSELTLTLNALTQYIPGQVSRVCNIDSDEIKHFLFIIAIF